MVGLQVFLWVVVITAVAVVYTEVRERNYRGSNRYSNKLLPRHKL